MAPRPIDPRLLEQAARVGGIPYTPYVPPPYIPPTFGPYALPPNFGAQMAGAGPLAQSVNQSAALVASGTQPAGIAANSARSMAASMQPQVGVLNTPAPTPPPSLASRIRSVGRGAPWAIGGAIAGPVAGQLGTAVTDSPAAGRGIGRITQGAITGGMFGPLGVVGGAGVGAVYGGVEQMLDPVHAPGEYSGVTVKSVKKLPPSTKDDKPLNEALNDLNQALIDVGATQEDRTLVYSEIGALQEQGTLTPAIVQEYTDAILAPVQQAEQLDTAEKEYNEQIASMEQQRQDALTAAINDLKGERGKQNLTANARSMALQNWASDIIGGLGGASSQGMDQTGAFAGNLPAGMQDTGRAMAASVWESNTAVGNAYQQQLATMAPFSPVLNPALDPNYGQPYTNAIADLTMQRGNVPQYAPWQPPEIDPYAGIYAEAARMQAEAALMNAQANTSGGSAAADAMLADLGLG